jgi:hypothetical protein
MRDDMNRRPTRWLRTAVGLALILSAAAAGTASADDWHGHPHGWRHGWHHPHPVYVYPPGYYYPPPPVVYATPAPPPVVYAPPPVVYPSPVVPGLNIVVPIHVR